MRAGLFGLLGREGFLAGVFGLLGLDPIVQLLGLLHHIGIILVELLQKIPARSELFEAGGSEEQIEERQAAVAVHAVRTVAEPALQIGYFGVEFVDARLRILHARLGCVNVGKSLHVIVGCLVEVILQRIERNERCLRFGLFIGRRRLGECERGHSERHRKRCGDCKPERTLETTMLPLIPHTTSRSETLVERYAFGSVPKQRRFHPTVA